MDHKKNLSILIPDGESFYLVAILHCLSHIKGAKIFVMSNVKHRPMRYSKYIHHFSYYKKTGKASEWIDHINKETSNHDIDIIMPLFEKGIKTLILHKDLVTEQSKLIFLPTWDAFNRANHKESLTKHLDEYKIPGPKSILLTSTESEVFETITTRFPLLVKPPENSGGGDGIRKFDTKEELKNYFEDTEIQQPLLLQEFIEGYDLGCNVLCKEGNILAFTIQKGNLWNQKPFSPQIGLRFIEDNEAYRTVERLMDSLSWTGVANVDMRYDSIHKEFKIIEINPRFWGPLDASLIAGVNFPYLLCLSTLGEAYEVPRYEKIAYLNLKGLINCLLKNRSYIPNISFIWNNTPLRYVIKDPAPIVYWFFWRAKNRLLLRVKYILKSN